MLEITFKVSAQEANYILNVLAERPFKEVVKLINRLNAETQVQVAEYEKAQDGHSNKRE